MTTPLIAEDRQFVLHPNLLRHVIERQAPSLAKAGLEAAMNAVDAGATKLLVTIDEGRMVVEDDGRGFGGDVDEIQRVFGTFGEPHEDGDAYLGEFRMGRGQLFAHGATTFESGPYRFQVDIRRSGTQWRIEQPGGFRPGCRITLDLYAQPTDSDVDELTELVRYLPIPVLINGRQVNEAPQDLEWDLETEDAWFNIGAGPLKIYNRGAFVRDYPAETWGLGGVVVSKPRLKVTFGRNEVMRDCEIFSRITKQLDNAFIAALGRRKGRSLPEAMRARALHLFVNRKLDFRTICTFNLLRDARGAWMSLRALVRFPAVAVGPMGSPHAWRAIELGKAMVLSAEDIDAIGVSLNRLLAAIRRDVGTAPALLTWEDVLADITLGRATIPEEKLGPHERAVLFGAQVASRAIAGIIERLGMFEGAVPVRRVIAGRHDSEDAWSDGESFVAVNASLIEAISKGKFSFSKASMLLAHAYLRTPVPTPAEDSDEEPIIAAMVDTSAALGLRQFALSHVDELSVFRSPLVGDPHETHRRWNNWVPIRDIGDVARAWAEDYLRRCPGLNIPPKSNLMMAAGIRTGEFGRAAASAEAPADADAWFETFQTAAIPKLKALALSHWDITHNGRKIIASRGKPGRTRLDRESDRSLYWLAEYLTGGTRAAGRNRCKSWLRLPAHSARQDIPTIPFSMGTEKKPRSIGDVLHEVVDELISAEMAIQRMAIFREYTSGGKRRSDTFKNLTPQFGEAHTVNRGEYTYWRYRKGLPTASFDVMDDNNLVVIRVSADHGPFRNSRFLPEDLEGTSCSTVFTVSFWRVAAIGWPRLAASIRRAALRAAGQQALAMKALEVLKNVRGKGGGAALDEAPEDDGHSF